MEPEEIQAWAGDHDSDEPAGGELAWCAGPRGGTFARSYDDIGAWDIRPAAAQADPEQSRGPGSVVPEH